MDGTLRLLILEDSQDDADLIILRLKQEGFNMDWRRVESETEYLSALDSRLDIIIADYSLPQYTGLRALEQLKERGLEVPFILISGTMGEEIAVQAIKKGATDYLLKDRPMRLGAAVRNALQERSLRKDKTRAEQTTQRMAERLKILHQVSQEIARVSLDLEQVYSAIHHAAQKLMPAEAFVISLVDENTQENVAVYLIDKEGRWPEMHIPANQGLTGYVCASGKPFLSNIYTPENEIQAIHFGDKEHVRSVLAVPMTLGDKMIGMLSAQSYQNGAYSSEDQSLLEMLSAHAAVAIQNARLHMAIRQSEEKYRVITENMRDMVWLMDMNLKTIYISPSTLRVRGFTIDEINNLSIDQHVTPESFKRISQVLAEKLTPENLSQTDLVLTATLELEFYRKDGSTLWSENTFAMVRDEQGKPEGIIGVGRDITERKQAEEALKNNEARYRALVEQIPAIAYTNSATQIRQTLYISPQIKTILGIDPQEWIEDNDLWQKIMHEDDRQRVLAEYYRTAETGDKFDTEYRLVTPKGRIIWIHDEATLIRNHLGEPLFWQGIMQDRTENKKVEEALSMNEMLLSNALKIAHLGHWEYDVENDIFTFNDHFYRIFHTTVEQVGGYTMSMADYAQRFVHPDDSSMVASETQKGIETTDPNFNRQLEHRIIFADGGVGYISVRWFVIKDNQGRTVKTYGVNQDITERKQAEQALRESEEKYRSLFENVPDGVYRTTPSGEILAANPALVKMLCYDSIDELRQTNAALDWWIDPQQREYWMHTLNESGELSNYVVRIKDKNDKEHFMLDNARVQRNEQGEIQYYQGTFTDITGRIQRQRELEALTAVGAALRIANTHSEMIPVILEQAMNLANAQGAAITNVDSYREDIVLNVKREKDEGYQAIHLQPGEGITSKVFKTGKTFVCDDITKEPEFALLELFPSPTAAICMPLTTSGIVISVLWVMRKEKFEEEELKVLAAITDMTANALQRASLFEQTTLQLRRMTSLQAIDLAITSSMDLHVTLNILLDQVISQLNVHAASVLLFNATSQTLEYSASKGFSTEMLKKYRTRRGGGLASQAAARMELVSCELTNCSEYPFLAEAGYLMQIAVPLIAKGQVKGVLELFHRDKLVTNPEWRIFFETLASQAAISIDNATMFADVQRANIELSMSYDATIEGWSRALDLRDQETEGHTQRVVQLTLELANTIGINGKELMHIRRGALLHDIGKMAIPDSILLKPGPLSDAEWVIMKQHPVFAYQLLHPIPYLRQALDIPHCHHEKWDGSGYPRNLKGTQIPLAARIFAIVDVYDAITSDRPYRLACSKEEALDYIRNNAGTHFEPKVVDAFYKIITT
jgi:PAS domain S-box-containing protein